MSRAPIVTLFGEVSTAGRAPSTFAVSAVIHFVFFILVLYVFKGRPRIIEASIVDHEPVRVINLSAAVAALRPYQPPVARPKAASKAVQVSIPADGPKAAAALPHLEPRKIKAKQTLVNPNEDLKILVKQEVPLPLIVLWRPEPVRVKSVVPAPPQETSAASVKPSLNAPNHEPDMADIQISTAPGKTEKPTLAPSSTAPIKIIRPQKEQQVPETASLPDAQPTPASVLSISTLKLYNGKAVLPPANQVAETSNVESAHPGSAVNGSTEPNNNSVTKENANGAGKNTADNAQSSHKGNDQKPPAPKAAPQKPAEAANANGTSQLGKHGPVEPARNTGLSILEPETNPKVTHVSLPPNGRYGAVVVGTSLVDAYPESEGIMTGRITYTVYLQVGAARNWILQYALAASVDRGVNSIRPDAPWPYDIYRPNLSSSEVNTDAILVHGLINGVGHFEQLSLVYPSEFPEAKLVLNSLSKWQFRPAMQQNLATSVEVLLIIPIS